MLLIYSNTNFNSPASGFYLPSTFTKFKEHIAPHLVASVDNKYYWVEDLHIIVPRMNNINDLSYLIDESTYATRCYFIRHTFIDNSGLHLMLELDRWGTEITNADLLNMFILKTNRDIQGIGFLDNIALTDSPTYQAYGGEYIPMKSLGMVVLINYNYEESIFSGSATSRTELFYFNVGDIKEALIKNFIGGASLGIEAYKNTSAVDIAVDIVGGINSVVVNDKTNKCQVLNAWFVENKHLKISTRKLKFNTKCNVTSINSIELLQLKINESYADFRLNKTDYDFYQNNIRVGTKYNALELNRYVLKSLQPRARILTKNDGIQIIIEDGESMRDITDSFRVDLTMNEGNVTALKGVNNTLKTLNNVFSSGAGVVGNMMDKNIVKSITSGVNLATSIIDRWDASPYGRYINTGDGILTFRNENTTDTLSGDTVNLAPALNPFIVTLTLSKRDELANIYYNGVSFFQPYTIDDLFLDKLIVEGAEVNAESEFDTYIQCNVEVQGVGTEFAESIASILRSGIRLKKV